MSARVAAQADALIRTFEEDAARALGPLARRGAGLYYTPPSVAAQVVELALRHGAVRAGSVVDPCAGAGAFLVAAARAGLSRLFGFDLDPAALRVARKALPGAKLRRADGLKLQGAYDLLISNPPYGHAAASERAQLLELFPALRGGEIDRYAAFLLKSLQLVRPGGTAALLIPDTWMFLSRASRLREEILRLASVRAIVDLGKPFAAAKDTRVQALVLTRCGDTSPIFVGCGREALAPATQAELHRTSRRGWAVYMTRSERALCEAMESASVPLSLACEVGYGLRTGNNVRHVARHEPSGGEVGLVGGEDVTPFALRWWPKTLIDSAPLKPLVLRQRGHARIGVQRIRTNSTAPWARWLEAAPVPVDLVCLDSLSTLSSDDDDRLWALLALVSSVALNRLHRLRTTDVNVKPSALRELPVPKALLDDPRELAALARRRAGGAGGLSAKSDVNGVHMDDGEVNNVLRRSEQRSHGRRGSEQRSHHVGKGSQVLEIRGMSDPRDILIPGGAREPLVIEERASAALDRQIDAAVYRLFRLPPALVETCERAFWQDRYPEQFQALKSAMSDPPARVAGMEGTA